jgi:hypothetical protein
MRIFQFYLLFTLFSLAALAQFKTNGPHPKNQTDSLVWIYYSVMTAETFIESDIDKIDKANSKPEFFNFGCNGSAYCSHEFIESKKLLENIFITTDTALQSHLNFLVSEIKKCIALTDSSDKMNKIIFFTVDCTKCESDSLRFKKGHDLLNQWKIMEQSVLAQLNEIKSRLTKLIAYSGRK